MATVKLVLRPVSASTGLATVAIRLTNDRAHTYFSLKKQVLPSDWNSDKDALKSSAPMAKNLNGFFGEMYGRAYRYLLASEVNQTPVTKIGMKVALGLAPPPSNLLSDFMVESIDERRASASSKQRYHQTARELMRHLPPQLEVAQINEGHIKQILNKLGNRTPPMHTNTIHKHLKFLRTVCNEAQAMGFLVRHPFARIRLNTIPSEKKRLYLPALQKLIGLLELATGTHREILNQFLFSCFTGCRYEDMTNLRWENIKDDVLSFTPAKTKKHGITVQIPLGRMAIRFLPTPRLASGHVWTTRFTNQAANRICKDLAAIAGLPAFSFSQTARHTFISLCNDAGVAVADTQAMVGHKKESTTARYTLRDVGSLWNAVEALDGLASELGLTLAPK